MSPALPLWSERPERLLVMVAHPGDAERVMGGSVARWVAAGAVAGLVCGTSGDSRAPEEDSVHHPTFDAIALATARERDQREAAGLIGYEQVTFLHRPDGALANDLALREQLVHLIRSFRPDAVAAIDPRVLVHPDGRLNPIDQREMGTAALDALRPAANPLSFPQLLRSDGLTPHAVRRLLLYEPASATAAVDVSDSLELKLRAAGVHGGDVGAFAHSLASIRARAQRDGEQAGVEAAEGIAVVELVQARD